MRNTSHTHHSSKPEKDSENEDNPEEATTQILDEDLAQEMEVEEPKDDDKDEEPHKRRSDRAHESWNYIQILKILCTLT